VLALVVGWDGNVNILEGSVRVAEGDDGDVDVAGLADGLVVDARVRNDDEPGLLERARDVVGEAARGEPASNRLCARVGGVLEDGSVTVGAGRDDADVIGVLDGGDDTGSEDELLPGLANVDQVDPFERFAHQRPHFPCSLFIRDNHHRRDACKCRESSACQSFWCQGGIDWRKEKSV
jgi:hypothetical protein